MSKTGLRFWKTTSWFLVIPSVVTMSYLILSEHAKHAACPHRPPFVKYDYLRIRNKRFPWGDGNKTFFHNPAVNALPDGYEDEEPQ